MPKCKDTQKHVTIQFFDNEEDTASRESVRRIAAAGYSVLSLPTSGPPAIWVEGYEVVGRTAIRGFADNLIKKATVK
ncbi:MAG: hypothetical protein V3R99_08025 [Thermoguttaceae bacterium]